jgi:3-mercaptopyruvate sulfurtransferase SseA
MPEGATMTTHVTETAAAPSELAVKHFQEMLAFETDCWDVHESLKSANADFIVVDVRGPNAFAKGHVKGAINIPHRDMMATRMADIRRTSCLSSTARVRIATEPIRLRYASPGSAYR